MTETILKIGKILIQMFFRFFFTVEYFGIENVPKSGAAVLAGNHPSYLDPILIYIILDRPVTFLAWDRLFKVPILGSIIRMFGAVPVNVYQKDSNAFEQAMKVLKEGKLLALFPEAGRSQHGYMESLKSGAARLAIYNNCPLVPITITGAYEAWPVSKLFPVPRKISVKFYEPIAIDQKEQALRRDDSEYHKEVMEQWREVINRRLIPGLKAHQLRDKLFAQPAWHIRTYEFIPVAIALLLVIWSKTEIWDLLLPPICYYLYLIADIQLIPQGRIAKVARDLSAPLLMLTWHPVLTQAVAMPEREFLSLTLTTSALLLPYYWANYYDTQRFLRGLTLSYYIAICFELLSPSAFGLHWAVSISTAVYSLYHRPLLWYCQLGLVVLYLSGLYWIFRQEFITAFIPYLLLGVVVNLYMIAVKFTAHDGREI